MIRKIFFVAVAGIIFSAVFCAKKDDTASVKISNKYPIATIKTSIGTIKIELWNDIAPKTVENFMGLATGNKEWMDPKTRKKEKKPFYDGLIFHKVISGYMIIGGCPLGTGTSGPGYYIDDEIFDNTGSSEIKGKIKDEITANRVFREIIIPYLRKTYEPDWDKDIADIALTCNSEDSGRPIMKHPVEYYIKKTGHKKPFLTRGKLKATIDYGSIVMVNSGPDTNGSQFFIVTGKNGLQKLNGKNTVFGRVIDGMECAERIQNIKITAKGKPVRDVKIISVTVST